MLILRCPRCGAIAYEGHFAFPKCHICHEELNKCRYCKHYPGDGFICDFSPDKSAVHGDDVRQCGSYRSMLQMDMSPSQISKRTNILACILTSAIMGIIVALLSVLPQPSQNAYNTISLRCRRELSRNESFMVTLSIPIHLQSTVVRIIIPKEILNAFSLLDVSPAPALLSGDERSFAYVYNGLAISKGAFKVRFKLRPLKSGVHKLRFEVIEEDAKSNSAKRDVLTWRVSVTDDAEGKKPLKQHLVVLLCLLSDRLSQLLIW